MFNVCTTEVYDSAISMEYANGSKYVMIKMVKLCE